MQDHVDAQFAVYKNMPEGQKKRSVGAAVLLRRMGCPGDFVNPVVFLAPEAARCIIARRLNVDGGDWMN